MAAEDDSGPEAAATIAGSPHRHRHHRAWGRRLPQLPRFFRQPWKLIPVVLIGLVIGFAALAAAAALIGQRPLRAGVAELSEAIDAVHQGDRAAATQDLDIAASDFTRAHSTLTRWWTQPAELIPGVSQQLHALRSASGAGDQVCTAGLEVSKALTSDHLPHGKALITMLRGLQTTLVNSGVRLSIAASQISGAQSSLLLPPISRRLDQAVTKVSEAAHDDQIAVSGVAAALQFLGGDGPRSYFLAVQTEAESRGSGGVIGNYGIVTAEDGTLRLTHFGTAQSLESKGDLATRMLIAPADYIARYSQFQPALRWANVPMSPDFPTVAEVIEGLYPQEGGSPVDGVISVDPFALADLLRATGPIDVAPWPEPLTAENAVAILLHDEYDNLTGPARSNFLGNVTKTAWKRFTSGDLPDLQTLIRDLRPAFVHKDLLLASTAPATEALIRKVGVGGGFSRPANSDFLAITGQNDVENKIDWYLHRSIDYQVSYTPQTGAINATVTVKLRNLAPTTGQAAYVIGSLGRYTKTNGENRSYLTIYTPWAFTDATVDGRPLLLNQSRELGVWADSAFVTIPPGGTTTVSVELLGNLHPASPYRLTMSSQPMVNADQVQLGVRLPGGDRFSDPTGGLTFVDGDREAKAQFELESNTSVSASLAR
jgi:hypothetical protein